MLWSRRTIFMALVVGLPVLGALVYRAFVEIVGPGGDGRHDVTGPTIFGMMIWIAYVRFSVPVLGVFYGTALIADEVEDKTITYLFTRPIPRSAVLMGKYLAYLACTLCVVLPSVVLVWLVVVPVGGGLGTNFPDLVTDLALIAIGLAVYGALFALIGCTLKRPLLFGLVFVFGWETIALAIPGYLKRFTVAYYVQGLFPHAMPNDSAISMFQEVMREIPSLTQCLFWMGTIEVVCLWLAMRAVSRREYVLEQ
jgi:ABC-type transport system involved in multi-copper enzyme maturation permease subunit